MNRWKYVSILLFCTILLGIIYSVQAARKKDMDPFPKNDLPVQTHLLSGTLPTDLIADMAVDRNGYIYIVGTTSSEKLQTLNGLLGYSGQKDVFIAKYRTDFSGRMLLCYASYLGGSGDDVGRSLAVDDQQIIYVTGTTFSTDFPLKHPFQAVLNGEADIFVTKIDTKLSGAEGLAYSTYFGGEQGSMSYYPYFVGEHGNGIAVDQNQHVYVTGVTESRFFPLKHAMMNWVYPIEPYGADAFLFRLDTRSAGGASLIYSTYISGTRDDWGNDIVVDQKGQAYITGGSTSQDTFPLRNEVMGKKNVDVEPFVMHIDTNRAGLDGLVYSTILRNIGWRFDSSGSAIGIDPDGMVYITGNVERGFPLVNAFQSYQNWNDAFLAKLDTRRAGQDSLLYSTYLGGSGRDYGIALAVSDSGRVFIAGNTASDDFPLINPYQQSQGNGDCFVACIDAHRSGESSVRESTIFGGIAADGCSAIALDHLGNVYMAGWTESANLPGLKSESIDEKALYIARFQIFSLLFGSI